MAKVVVIGRNYTSRLGMARAAGRAGHQVYIIRTNPSATDDIDKASRYVCGYYHAKEPDRTQLLNTLLTVFKSEKEKVILLPVDDYAASTIDNNIELLKHHFLFPHVNMTPGAVNKLMDKDYQKKLAREAGLRVAEGWTIEIKNHHYSLPDNLVYPCFPKPQVSFLGNKRCMKKCSTEKELKEVLDEIAEVRDCPILIEKFVDIEKEYGVLGFCENGFGLLPGIVDKVMIGEGAHKGVTKLGVVTPLSEKPELKKGLQKFISLSHFTGLCDIDLYESNGVIFFNELNLRFGAFGYSILCAGANLPACFITSIQSQKVDIQSISIRPKTICLSEKVNYDDYVAKYYGVRRYFEIKNMADYTFLACKDDPKPYQLFRWQVIKTMAKRIIRSIIHFNRRK